MSPDILKEHVYIRLVADRTRALLAAPEATLTQTRWQQLMDHELRGLQATIKRHFAHEERGGYMAELIESHPETESKFAELFAQHGAMKQTLAELIANNDAGAPIAELRPGVKALLATLAAHEAAETELVQDAIQHDTGSGD